MRRYEKKYVIESLNMLKTAYNRIREAVIARKKGGLSELLVVSQQLAIAVGEYLESIDGQYGNIISWLEDLCEQYYKITICEGYNCNVELIGELIDNIEHAVVYDYPTEKLKITFLPYKASMWTAMESIWMAADKDEECIAKVVPIPYYNIGNINNVTVSYEGNNYPEYVPVVDFREYNLNKERPDIIVIHNPYDDKNTLTRIPKQFYSSELVRYTDKLVYSPYFTLGTYTEERHKSHFLMPANENADYIICQSERVKALYELMGYESEKLLAFGSPKIDSVINCKLTKNDIPYDWQEKIKGKKVFLLNTHWSYFPVSFINTKKTGNYAVKFCNEILQAFLDREDCALIWRPHPLLKNMINDKFPQCLEWLNDFERRIKEADNGIVDEGGNYMYSFVCADALISTWSSLINEFMVTKKPILIFQTRILEKYIPASPININVNYFRFGEGGYTFEAFRDNVINGIDPKYQERILEIEKAFPNLESSAGDKIYSFLSDTVAENLNER